MTKKKYGIMSFLLLLGLLSGCGSSTDTTGTGAESGSSGLNPFSTEADSGKERDISTEEGKKGEIEWSVKPFLVVDDIEVPDYTISDRERQVSVVKKNGLFGYARYEGNYVVEPTFDQIFDETYLPYSEYAATKYPINEFGTNISVIIGEDGNLSRYMTDYVYHQPYMHNYIYDYDHNRTVCTLFYSDWFTDYTKDRPVVVAKATNVEGRENDTCSANITHIYGLATKDKLLVDCQYEDACMVEGVDTGYYAFQKDGKWAFFNAKGEQLTDFIYDPFEGHLQYDCWYTEPAYGKQKAMPYLPTDGYVAVCQDGKYGYIDLEGGEVYAPGTFDEVRPVHNGRAWAKYRGKWGVLEFPQVQATEDPEKKETKNELEGYETVLSDFRAASEKLRNGEEEISFREKYNLDVVYMDLSGDLTPSYALYDLNGDGQKELFLSDQYGMIFCIFSLVDGKARCLTQSDVFFAIGWGTTLDLCENGNIRLAVSEKYLEHTGGCFTWFRLSSDGSELKEYDGCSYSIDGWPSDNLIYTYYDHNRNMITEEEYNAEYRKYAPVTLEYQELK